MAISKFKTAAMALLSLFLCTGVAVIAIKSIPSPAAADIVANATVPISAPAAVESNWPVTFSDGTTVELLGIHDEPAPAGDVAEALGLSSTSQPAATPWWLPDGSEFPAPLHEDRPRIHMSPVPKGHRLLRFILTMPAAAARRTGITVNVLPSTRCGVSSYGNGGPRWIEVVAIVPAAAKTADLRIGLANGPWTDDITYDVATKQFTKSPTAEATINKIDVTDENGEACVTVYGQEHERPTRDSQIVAMAGNRRLQIQHGRGDFAAMHNYYRASADQITEVILQSRPFEYMAIKNVSLSPTKTPTKVEVVPLADSPAPK